MISPGVGIEPGFITTIDRPARGLQPTRRARAGGGSPGPPAAWRPPAGVVAVAGELSVASEAHACRLRRCGDQGSLVMSAPVALAERRHGPFAPGCSALSCGSDVQHLLFALWSTVVCRVPHAPRWQPLGGTLRPSTFCDCPPADDAVAAPGLPREDLRGTSSGGGGGVRTWKIDIRVNLVATGLHPVDAGFELASPSRRRRSSVSVDTRVLAAHPPAAGQNTHGTGALELHTRASPCKTRGMIAGLESTS